MAKAVVSIDNGVSSNSETIFPLDAFIGMKTYSVLNSLHLFKQFPGFCEFAALVKGESASVVRPRPAYVVGRSLICKTIRPSLPICTGMRQFAEDADT